MADCILVLDDELNYAKMISDLLEEHGFVAEISTDPRDALDRLHEKSYSLIIADYKMPEVDGAQFLAEARKALPQLPVIMISGMMSTHELLKVANIGVTLVLEKPFNVDVFLEYVRRFAKPSTDEVVDVPEASVEDSLVEEDIEVAVGDLPYPRPLKFLVDDSDLSQRYIADLWESVSSSSHILVKLPTGAEFSEIVRECSVWKESPSEHCYHFSLLELGLEEVRESLLELAADPMASPVVAITQPDDSIFDFRDLKAFMLWARDQKEISGRQTFIYGFPARADLSAVLADEEIGEMLSGPIEIPELYDRLVDLAGYVSQFLNEIPRDTKKSMSPDAVGLLLQYPWPGNHRELRSVLRRAFNLASGREVDVFQVEEAIRSKHGEVSSTGLKLNLESFLIYEQRNFLRSKVGSGGDLRSVSQMVGQGMDRLDSSKGIEEQPLLFPELLKD